MFKLATRLSNLNIWVKIVFCFCLWGGLCNTALVGYDIWKGDILLRLHVGFLILYIGQIVFILLHERQVWALAVLQGIMALLTNADFTFMPLVRLLGNGLFFLFPNLPMEYIKISQYVLVSLAFTLQMLSAFILFSLLPKNTSQKI